MARRCVRARRATKRREHGPGFRADYRSRPRDPRPDYVRPVSIPRGGGATCRLLALHSSRAIAIRSGIRFPRRRRVTEGTPTEARESDGDVPL